MHNIAAIQMISTENVATNLAAVGQLVAEAAQAGAQLLVLPENFAFMGLNEADKLAIAEDFSKGPIQDFIAKLAVKHQCWIVAGTIPVRCENPQKVKAASLVFNASGSIVARYDKIHLFDVRVSEQEAHQESRSIAPGSTVVVLETPVGKLGLSVCYDVRFPELYRALSHQGAEIFIVPAAFTAITGAAHWEILLRARAIENLSYVIAAGQGGRHPNGRATYGHSMIVDPWGTILASHEVGAGVVTATVDLNKMYKLRQQFPALEHRVI